MLPRSSRNSDRICHGYSLALHPAMEKEMVVSRMSMKEIEALLDYVYPEDLPKWGSVDSDRVEIGSPILPYLRSGDVCYMNNMVIQRLFLMDLLRNPISKCIPIAFLSMTDQERNDVDEALICTLRSDFKDEEAVMDKLSDRSLLSKRLHARRFCEAEDELRTLSEKNYRIIVISSLENLPHLDAESIGKGYCNHFTALRSIAEDTGAAIIVFCGNVPHRLDGAICLNIEPEYRKFLPPCMIAVHRDNAAKAIFRVMYNGDLSKDTRFIFQGIDSEARA